MKKANFVKTIKAVLWSFFGIRRRNDLEDDLAGNEALNPVHAIVAGVLIAVLFVSLLMAFAHWIAKHA